MCRHEVPVHPSILVSRTIWTWLQIFFYTHFEYFVFKKQSPLLASRLYKNIKSLEIEETKIWSLKSQKFSHFCLMWDFSCLIVQGLLCHIFCLFACFIIHQKDCCYSSPGWTGVWCTKGWRRHCLGLVWVCPRPFPECHSPPQLPLSCSLSALSCQMKAKIPKVEIKKNKQTPNVFTGWKVWIVG